MRSKRYKKLPEKTNLEKPNTIENLIIGENFIENYL